MISTHSCRCFPDRVTEAPLLTLLIIFPSALLRTFKPEAFTVQISPSVCTIAPLLPDWLPRELRVLRRAKVKPADREKITPRNAAKRSREDLLVRLEFWRRLGATGWVEALGGDPTAKVLRWDTGVK